jgi:hypothetical protein
MFYLVLAVTISALVPLSFFCRVVWLALRLPRRNKPARVVGEPWRVPKHPGNSAIEASSGEGAKTGDRAVAEVCVREESLPANSVRSENDVPTGGADVQPSAPSVLPPPFLWLKRDYYWLNTPIVLPLLVAIFVCTAAWLCLLLSIRRLYLAQLPPSVHLFATPWVAWCVPAFVLGIFSSAVPLEAITRRWLGKRYADYLEWDLGRGGFANRWILSFVWVPVFVLMTVLIAGSVGALTHWYVRFGEEEIGVNHLLSFDEQVYTYDQVRDIVHSTHLRSGQKANPANRYYIVLNDGHVLNSAYLPTSPADSEEVRATIEFVSRKTGKPVRDVQFPEDVDPPDR